MGDAYGKSESDTLQSQCCLAQAFGFCVAELPSRAWRSFAALRRVLKDPIPSAKSQRTEQAREGLTVTLEQPKNRILLKTAE